MTVLPCSDGITALPGAQWLTEVLAWVPDGVDPWVWLAPDEDDAPAMVAWYEQHRFTARGENGIEQAWRQMVDWAREQPEGTCPPGFPGRIGRSQRHLDDGCLRPWVHGSCARMVA